MPSISFKEQSTGLTRSEIEIVDFSKVKIAVKVPEDFTVDSVAFMLGFSGKASTAKHDRNKPAANQQLQRKFFLPTVKAPLTKYLRKQKSKGAHIYQFEFNDEMAKLARGFQEELKVVTSAPDTTRFMGIGTSISFCLNQDADFNQAMETTFYIKTNLRKDFYPLSDNQPRKMPITPDMMKQNYCEIN